MSSRVLAGTEETALLPPLLRKPAAPRAGITQANDLRAGMPVGDLMQLQRAIGNKALGALLVQSPPEPLVQRGKKKTKNGKGENGAGKDKGGNVLVTDGVDIDGVLVNKEGYPQWEMNGEVWHLNVAGGGTHHVTSETSPKQQYFFERDGDRCRPCRPPKGETGRNSHMFSALPKNVRTFVEDNFLELIK
ncbi:MAG: hypothetical protein ACYCXN_08145 [Acidimicrobiales bacterium]